MATPTVRDGGHNGGDQNEGGTHGNGPVASGSDTDDNHGGLGDGYHGYNGYSDEHHGDRPVPSFWNFLDNEHGHEHANNNHHQFELMRHHA